MRFRRTITTVITVAAEMMLGMFLMADALAPFAVTVRASAAAGNVSAASSGQSRTSGKSGSGNSSKGKSSSGKSSSGKSSSGTKKSKKTKSSGKKSSSGTSSSKQASATSAAGTSKVQTEGAGSAAADTSSAGAAGSAFSVTSSDGRVTGVFAIADTTVRTAEETSFFYVLNSNPSLIENFGKTSSGFRWAGMTGGQETASCWNVVWQTAEGAASDGTGVCTLRMPLKSAMGGRTLLSGESLQAVYNDGSGRYHELATAVSGGTVTVTVPYTAAGDTPRLLYVITSGYWAPSGAAYDYLAIGNSITVHPRMTYWPDAMGMGASRVSNDYYHLTAAGLQSLCAAKGKNFSSAVMNYALWEVSSGQRSQYLYLLDPYLNSSLDLITVQLGENARMDDTGFAADFPALIQYIRAKAPNARVIIVGNFWKDDVQEQVKQQCAAAYGCSYADLSSIAVTVYPGAVGSPSAYTYNYETVYNADGVGMVSSEPAVNLHPNDAGMRAIAESVLKAVGNIR